MRSLAPDYPHSIATNEFGFYCLPEVYAKREAPRFLARGDVYEAATVQFLRQLVMQGGDVISGGAFIGDFLPALSQALVKGAKLHTFEPNPFTATALHYTLALNRMKNVVYHPVAVSAEAGQLKLQTEAEDGTALAGSSRIVGADATGKTIEVAVETLDNLVPKTRKVSVIHLDVENHEVAALGGAERLIGDHAPDLVLEAPKAWMRRNIETHLEDYHSDLGYVHCGQLDRNAIYRALDRA